MELKEEEVESRVNREDNLVNIVRIHKGSGRRTGDTGLPDFMKKVVAGVDGGVGEIADAFGISPSSVSAYKRGLSSPNGVLKEELKKEVENALAKANDLAVEKLTLALEALAPEKLSELKAREAAAVARDMAIVAEKTRVGDNGNGARVIIFAPRVKAESEFNIIDINPISVG